MKCPVKIKVRLIVVYQIVLLICDAVFGAVENKGGEEFLLGADVSFIPQMERAGVVFKENGSAKDPLKILREHGLNAIRLRTWNNPRDGNCDLKSTLEMAKRVKLFGFKLVLNFHYSDTWADPAHQTKPAAWKELSFAELEKAVFEYTRDAIWQFVKQDTAPDIVQTGNEITAGFLWDDGNIGKFNDEEHWDKFTRLLKSALRGVREGSGDKRILTMLHIDCGGDNGKSRWFFDNIKKRNVEYDLIGVSYYYWWHGGLDDLKNNIIDLAARYEKPVVVIETAHPWRLFSPNMVRKRGQIQAHPGYEASVEGQAKFLRDLIRIVRNVPNNRGIGVFYWAPEWIPAKGIHSNWGEVTLFSDDAEPLPSLKALGNIAE